MTFDELMHDTYKNITDINDLNKKAQCEYIQYLITHNLCINMYGSTPEFTRAVATRIQMGSDFTGDELVNINNWVISFK